MSKFTVKKEIFTRLLKLCELSLNKELSLTINPDNILGSVHFNKNVTINASIPGKYEAVGEIGIDSLPPMIKLLNADTSADITLTPHENVLTSEYSNVEYSVALRAPQYIVNKPDEKKVAALMESLKGCPNFTLTPTDIAQVLTYQQSIGPKSVVVSGKDTKVTLLLKTAKEQCKLTYSLRDTVDTFKVPFSELFFKVLDALKESTLVVTIHPEKKLGHIRMDSKEINFDCLLIGIL